MGVRNVMEIVVGQNIDRILDGMPQVCRCAKCKDDISAYALNILKPKYCTTQRGETIAKAMTLEPQHYLDVVTALTQGIQQVGRNPRHD